MQNRVGNRDELKTNPDSNGTPRWVKVFGIIGLILVVLFVILHLTGNSLGGHTSHSNITEPGVKQP